MEPIQLNGASTGFVAAVFSIGAVVGAFLSRLFGVGRWMGRWERDIQRHEREIRSLNARINMMQRRSRRDGTA